MPLAPLIVSTFGYVVFARLTDLESVASDRIAHDVDILDTLLANAAGEDAWTHSSVYGGFVVVPERIDRALHIAREVAEKAAVPPRASPSRWRADVPRWGRDLMACA